MIKRKLTVIGTLIHKRLIELNMTVKQLADLVGVDDTYITRIIRGSIVKSKYIPQIESALGIKLNDT